MKSRLWWIPVAAGGAFLAYKLWQKSQAAANLTYSLKRVVYRGSDISKSWFDIDLGIVNQSNVDVSFRKFFATVRYQGEILATVSKDAGLVGGQTIKSNAETVITIRVYISHLQTATNLVSIVSAILNKERIDGLRLQGLLYAGAVQVPISEDISFDFSGGGGSVSGIKLINTPRRIAGCSCEARKRIAVEGLSVLN